MRKFLLETKSKLLKKARPSNDFQVKKVYNLDYHLFEYIKKNKLKIKYISDDLDFLEVSEKIFNMEGIYEYIFEINQNKSISLIDYYYFKTSYTQTVVDNKNYEVLLHELAHALCFYRAGYTYKDGHGEMFVYFLFYLINKYYDISYDILHDLADKHKVCYYTDTEIINKKINKIEYTELLSKNLVYNNYQEKSLNFKSTFDKENEKFICLSSSNDDYYYFEREFFIFEKISKLNILNKFSESELFNVFLISPIYKSDISGRFTKLGSHNTFQYMDISDAESGNVKSYTVKGRRQLFELRKQKIDDMKKTGYQVIMLYDVEQFSDVATNFVNRFI